MVHIEWNGIVPTAAQRAQVETRFGRLVHPEDVTVTLTQRGASCEACLRIALPQGTTQLRLHGADVGAVVERLLELLRIVARERRFVAAVPA
jgi:hypothetical protein